MAGPKNGIVGSEYGIDLPETQVDPDVLAEEERMAKYSRSHEYKKLTAYWKSRIEYYQAFLPDGTPVVSASKKQREDMWSVANLVIAELNNVMSTYESADEKVKSRVQ